MQSVGIQNSICDMNNTCEFVKRVYKNLKFVQLWKMQSVGIQKSNLYNCEYANCNYTCSICKNNYTCYTKIKIVNIQLYMVYKN